MRSRPPGASGSSRQALALALGEVLGSHCCRLLSRLLSEALADRGGRGVHRPVRAPIARPGRHRCSAPALRASPEFRQVLGNSSSALFQLPRSHPPPARRLEAGASSSPSPCLAPSLIPTTPPPRGADTPPGGAWARRSRAQPLSLLEPGPVGGRGAAARGAAAGNPRQGSLEPARRRRRRRRRGNRTERPADAGGPGKRPRGSSSALSAAGLRPAEGCSVPFSADSCWRTRTPAPQLEALQPSGNRGTFAVSPGEVGARSFLNSVQIRHARRAKINSEWKGLGVRRRAQ